MSFQEENDRLLWHLLSRFFNAWKEPYDPLHGNWNKVELIINSACNLNCKYCYFARFGNILVPPQASKVASIRRNLEIFLEFLKGNKYTPIFEIFSGEPLVQNIGLEVCEKVLDYQISVGSKTEIVIPTNGTFLLYQEKKEKVEALIKKASQYKIPLLLSFSVDGKYCESNRPFKRGQEVRDDTYYDETFEFAHKYSYKFHPMIYSEKIEDWKRNFLWFQEMFEKVGMPWNSLYLLEVRNQEWSASQIHEFMKFLDFLIEWTWDKCGHDKERFLEFLFEAHGFNILNIFATTGRGLGCSLQSTLHVRLGDLSIVPCHRTAYPPFVIGQLKVNDGKINGVKAHNIELFTAILTLDGQNLPVCESCILKTLCCKGCLGSQFENTGDLFSPIPTVCLLEHARVLAILLGLDKIGILKEVLNRTSPSKLEAINWVLKTWKEIQ